MIDFRPNPLIDFIWKTLFSFFINVKRLIFVFLSFFKIVKKILNNLRNFLKLTWKSSQGSRSYFSRVWKKVSECRSPKSSLSCLSVRPSLALKIFSFYTMSQILWRHNYATFPRLHILQKNYFWNKISSLKIYLISIDRINDLSSCSFISLDKLKMF